MVDRRKAGLEKTETTQVEISHTLLPALLLPLLPLYSALKCISIRLLLKDAPLLISSAARGPQKVLITLLLLSNHINFLKPHQCLAPVVHLHVEDIYSFSISSSIKKKQSHFVLLSITILSGTFFQITLTLGKGLCSI